MKIDARERDLGGFMVRRVLPFATHRMVGPFIFFDQMGPVDFAPGKGMDVRPHPHINLATVTYLFEGKIQHRDSLGSNQMIEPGAINWMTTGRGMVHSERTPADLRSTGGRLHGIQCWVALPEEHEEATPTFAHHAKETLPKIQRAGLEFNLLLGEWEGVRSPVAVHSDMFYLETHIPKGREILIPTDNREGAIYVVKGAIKVNGQPIAEHSMGVAEKTEDLQVFADEDSHLMILGGKALGARNIFWNFVSSSAERLEKAKADWARGPGAEGSPFGLIPGDDKEFIPLPQS